MPYAPGAQDISGQLYAQGIERFGQGIAQGIQNYTKKKEEDATLTGIIEAFGDKKITALATNMTPENQKLVQKFLDHKASLNDKTTLVGALQGAHKLAQDAVAEQVKQQQAELLKQQAAQLLKSQQDEEAARAAMARAFAPVSPMGTAINQGANFQQLGGLPAALVSPSSLAAFRKYVEGGAPLTAEARNMFATGIAGENSSEATDARRELAQAKLNAGSMMNQEQINALGAQGIKVNAVPMGNGMFRVQTVSTLAPAPTTTVNMPQPGGVQVFEAIQKERESAAAAQKAAPAFKSILEELSKANPDVITGKLATPITLIKSIANSLGADYKSVATTQALQASLAPAVLATVKGLGAGTGISNADRAFAEKAVGADFTLDFAAIKRLAEIGLRATELTTNNYNERLNRTFPKNHPSSEIQLFRAASELSGQNSPVELSVEERLKNYR